MRSPEEGELFLSGNLRLFHSFFRPMSHRLTVNPRASVMPEHFSQVEDGESE